MSTDFPKALPVPTSPVIVLDQASIDRAIEMSRKSPRGRIIQPFHRSDEDDVHRMLNVMQPGSYVPPHRHLDPPKDEAIVLLGGKACAVIFSDEGEVTEHHVLEAGTPSFGIDIVAGVFHTFLPLAPDTVLYEIKSGPYKQATDKDFAPWAPSEGDLKAGAYYDSLLSSLGLCWL